MGRWRAGLEDLADALSHSAAAAHAARAEYVAEIAPRMQAWEAEAAPRLNSNETPVHMARLCREVNRTLPEEAVLVDTKPPGRSFTLDRGFAPIGYGLPGGMGAALARLRAHRHRRQQCRFRLRQGIAARDDWKTLPIGRSERGGLRGDCPNHGLWHKTFRSFTYTGSRGATTNAISGIDIAPWDVRGKVPSQRVYALLGSKVHDDILLYTHLNSRNLGTDEGVVQEIRAIVDSGHTALKFDPFPHQRGIGVADDIHLDGGMRKQGEKAAAQLTTRIREIAGPEVQILIDAHGRFNVPTAIRLCRTLEDAGQIDWFEEPVPVPSYHALHQVREKVNARISVGERLHTKWEILPLLENRLTDHLMPDVTWTGGISELKKITTPAEAFYIPVSPHDASGPINVIASAHVMMSTPNFYRLETSRWDLFSYNAFITMPLDNSGGRLKVPTKPGFGILRSNVVDGFREP